MHKATLQARNGASSWVLVRNTGPTTGQQEDQTVSRAFSLIYEYERIKGAYVIQLKHLVGYHIGMGCLIF